MVAEVSLPSDQAMPTSKPPRARRPRTWPSGQALGQGGEQLELAAVALKEHLGDAGGAAEVAVDLKDARRVQIEEAHGGEVGDQFDGGEVVVSGLELSAGYSWDFGRLNAPVSLEYTWTGKAEFQSSFDSGYDPWGEVESGDELPYIPEHQLRASGGLVMQQWRVNVGVSYIGDLRTKAGQGAFVASESIDAHVVWDVIAAWNFTPNLSTYLKVDNLFDETYIAARRPAGVRPGLPRTAYLGLTYRL